MSPSLSFVLQFDDRRYCDQCSLLTLSGRCSDSRAASVIVNRAPVDDAPEALPPHRCIAFAPLKDDPDQRRGFERWPGLVDDTPGNRAHYRRFFGKDFVGARCEVPA